MGLFPYTASTVIRRGEFSLSFRICYLIHFVLNYGFNLFDFEKQYKVERSSADKYYIIKEIFSIIHTFSSTSSKKTRIITKI